MSEQKSLVLKMADRYAVDGAKLMQTLKSTAFQQRNGPAPSDEQMMALLVVADQYKLNPFTKEIYAFPDRQNGIVPVVGVDGWSRIINSHPQFDGMDYRYSDEMTQPAGAVGRCHEWVECIMYRKDRSHPVTVREYLDEVYRAPFKAGMKGPWQTHTKRFLRHKATIQCARMAFGFVGIFDQDEAERIQEGEKNMGSAEVVDVQYESLVSENQDSIDAIKQGIADEDLSAAAEAWYELGQEVQNGLWRAPSKGGCFTTQERTVMKSTEFRKSFFGEDTKQAS